MQYWRLSTKVFRLRSLLIGRRYTLVRHSNRMSRLECIVWAILDVPHQWLFGKYDPSETLMRVPSADSVVLLTTNGQRQPMFIPLNEDKTPKTKEAKIRMIRQDILAKRATPKRDPVKDYTVVRVPPYWRTRVHMFIFSTLAASALFVALLVVLPILLGRRITSAWVGEVHDGYAYVRGHILLSCIRRILIS
jgi:E3 ubiquitin-protein ligase MARCH6